MKQLNRAFQVSLKQGDRGNGNALRQVAEDEQLIARLNGKVFPRLRWYNYLSPLPNRYRAVELPTFRSLHRLAHDDAPSCVAYMYEMHAILALEGAVKQTG